MGLSDVLRHWRESYYTSKTLTAVARPMYKTALTVSRQIEYKIRTNGASIRLPNGRNLRIARDSGVGLASNLYWKGLDGYEPSTSRTLRFFFSRVDTFVDVGANYGFYSLLAALWNSRLRVVAFEPLAEIRAGFQENIRLNRLEDRITVFPAALSDVSGRAMMYLPVSNGVDAESTGTLAEESWQRKKNAPSRETDAIALDDFDKQNPIRVDLVKIDVEDYEASVLAGMRGIVQRDRPFVVCEILPRSHGNERTKAILHDIGYTPYWITPSGYVKVSRFDFERKVSQDFLLAPASTSDEIVTDLETLCAARTEKLIAC